jgi:hypothetical protein
VDLDIGTAPADMADMDMVSELADMEAMDMVSELVVSELVDLEVTVTDSEPVDSELADLEVMVTDSEPVDLEPVVWEELDAIILTMLALSLAGTNATLTGVVEDFCILDTETAISLT